MKKRGKIIYLSSGSEGGFNWVLQVDIRETTKEFGGSFGFYDEEAKRKKNIRQKDAAFFIRRLSGEMYRKYEIDHDWENGGRVTLKTPKEHRNDHFGKSNQLNWTEEEEWLQEK